MRAFVLVMMMASSSSVLALKTSLRSNPDPYCRTGRISLPTNWGDDVACCPSYCDECSDYPTCSNVRGQNSTSACCKSVVMSLECGKGYAANVCLNSCADSSPPCILKGGHDALSPLVVGRPGEGGTSFGYTRNASTDCGESLNTWRAKADAAIAAAGPLSGSSQNSCEGQTCPASMCPSGVNRQQIGENCCACPDSACPLLTAEACQTTAACSLEGSACVENVVTLPEATSAPTTAAPASTAAPTEAGTTTPSFDDDFARSGVR